MDKKTNKLTKNSQTVLLDSLAAMFMLANVSIS